jgi:hypothetical protein
MFVLEVMPQFKADYSLIIDGKYSQISDKAKKLIIQGREETISPTGKRSKSTIAQVLTKDISLKEFWEKRIGTKLEDQEVWSKMNVEKEVFNQHILDSLDHGYKIKTDGQESIEQDRTVESGNT